MTKYLGFEFIKYAHFGTFNLPFDEPFLSLSLCPPSQLLCAANIGSSSNDCHLSSTHKMIYFMDMRPTVPHYTAMYVAKN